MIAHTIAIGTHGRYLIEPPAAEGPAPVLVACHGYGENAEAQLDRMRLIPGADRWRLVAIQALNRFYQRRDNQVVANWMTRQDRDLVIGDNLAYVAAVVDAVERAHPGAPHVVFAGFSQGVSMMFRAATALTRPVAGVIAVGGDVPPELDAASLARVGRALVCHGSRDPFYAPAMFDRDVERLRAAQVVVEPLAFDGGHEWSGPVLQAASVFLRERL